MAAMQNLRWNAACFSIVFSYQARQLCNAHTIAQETFLMYNLDSIDPDLAAAFRAKRWHDEKPEQLLGVSNDAKTIKGEKIGVSTAILYLSPHDISGVNMCPMAAIAQCATGCLNTAGRGAMTTVQLSRLRKTLYFNQYRDEFIEQLKREIKAHIRLSIKKNMVPAIRLNGTSDIRWELLIWNFMVEMRDEYGARFYDYTKIPNRIIPHRDVYDLTFSYSGVTDYAKYYKTARAMGYRIAVVFRSKDIIPTRWDGLDVVSGDDSDVRFMDDHNVAVALYAKGKARHDTTGFVID